MLETYHLEKSEEPTVRLSFNHPKSGNTNSQGEIGDLTIVTRCYNGPDKLAKNMISLSNQTRQDYDQVLIHGEVGTGLLGTSHLLSACKDYVKGRYVLLLDDDWLLVDDEFVEKLKDRNEDIVLFNMGGNDMSQPRCCLVMKNEVFQKYIHRIEDVGSNLSFLEGLTQYHKDIMYSNEKLTQYNMGDIVVTAIQDKL
jgi:hypothetical protein